MSSNNVYISENFSGEYAQRDDQKDSFACVRFALSKAVTNYLHTKKLIDVKQSEVNKMLVQESGNICGMSIDNIFSKFNDMLLIIQDTTNLIKDVGAGSFWEVKTFIF